MAKQHGALVPPDGADDTTRGNHVLQGHADVVTEANRAAINILSTDVGRVVRQTGGDRPGLYLGVATGTGLDKWKYLGGVPDYSDDRKIQTTDATVTTIATYATLADSKSITMKAKVWARRSGGSAGSADDQARYVVEALFNRDGSSVVTEKDTDFLSIYEDQTDWDLTFEISGQNILVRVKGALNNNVEWRCQLEVSEHG